MLTPLVVVVMNELSYCIHKLFIGFKMGLSQILCKVQTAIKQEQFYYEAADGETGCRLNNNITPARGNVKGGEAVVSVLKISCFGRWLVFFFILP